MALGLIILLIYGLNSYDNLLTKYHHYDLLKFFEYFILYCDRLNMQLHGKLLYYYPYDKINFDGNLYYDIQTHIIVIVIHYLVFTLKI